MKSLHLNDLKKNEAVPDSYEIAVAYKGRKVEIILDNYAYTLQQLLETANNVLVCLPTLDEKAKKYLAHQNIDCFNECNEKNGRPEATEECLERLMTLSAIQFFDESIDFYYNISGYNNHQLIVEVSLIHGYKHPEFQQWYLNAPYKSKFLEKLTSFFKKMFWY